MPVRKGVGYGRWTPVKLDHLRAILAMHVGITKAVLRKNPFFVQEYHFIDATAGPGTYDVNGEQVQGSPLLFLSVAEKHQLHYRADMIEKESANAQHLRKQLPMPQYGSVKVHCCEYRAAIFKLLTSEDDTRLGLFFVDPTTGIPDFNTAKYVSQMRPRMEILMYLSATNVKRAHDAAARLLSERMAGIDKRHWIVRRPFPGDAHQWTFLLGSNTDLFGDYRKIDFYRLNSKEAQAFFPKLNLSRRQRRERFQPPLFD
jgi:three-Cys-motif partner protein